MTCGAIHPDQPQMTCLASSGHDLHLAFGPPPEMALIEWPNEEYRPPAGKPSRRGAAEGRLIDIAGGIPPKQTSTPEDRNFGSKEEGMRAAGEAESTAEFRRVFLAALREVAETHEFLSSDDVWALLKSRGFEYHGSRQAVGPMVSSEGVKNGWYVYTGEKVEPRKDLYSNSGIPIGKYRSLIYRADA